MNKEYILPEGVEAIQETITLWRGKRNYFHEKDLAELELAVDRYCQICGKPTGNVHHVNCPECRFKNEEKRFLQMPYKDWDGETPVWLYNTDIYFFSVEEVIDYATELGIKVSELWLVIAEPVQLPEFDIEDFLYEKLEVEPEDINDIVSDSKREIINTFVNNILLEELGNDLNLWKPGKYRTSFWVEGKE